MKTAARLCILCSAISIAMLQSVAHAATIPFITTARADTATGTLNIQGLDFVPSPLPRVFLGTDAGGFQQLVVVAATDTSVTALLPGLTPGTYQLIVNFGGKLPQTAAIAVAIGAVGPKGDRG